MLSENSELLPKTSMYVSPRHLTGTLGLRLDNVRDHEHEVASAAEFLRSETGRLFIKGRVETELSVPSAVTEDDLGGFYEACSRGAAPSPGKSVGSSHVIRQRHKYVLAIRGLEGIIFDAEGFIRDSGFFSVLPHLPPGISRRGDLIEIDSKLLSNATYISEPMIISYNGNAHNYYHMLVESAVSLDLLQSIFGRHAGIFFPKCLDYHGTMRHRELLSRMGYAPSCLREVASEIALAEDVIWLENYYIEAATTEQLRAFRERLLHGIDPDRQTPSRST